MNTSIRSRIHAVLGVVLSLAFAVGSGPARAEGDEVNAELLAIQHAWERANYETPHAAVKTRDLEALAARTDAFVHKHPTRAEPLVWQGIVRSSLASAKGGLGALSLAKKSRESLLAALKVDPQALDGSAYTSLGALYYKVPGWPIGFGDHKEAGAYLRKALELNPGGIDPNYFYGELLFEDGNYAEALRYLQKAMSAPPRPERSIADAGRRGEITALIEQVKSKKRG